MIKLIIFISKLIAVIGITGGVALAFVNVVARYIFNSGISWASELTNYLFIWSLFFGAVYCFYKDAHIAVDILLVKVNPKFRKILLLISLFVSLIFVVSIAYYGYKYVLLYMDLGEVSVDLNIPLWIPYLTVPISFAFSGIILIDKIIKLIKTPSNQIKIKTETDELMEEIEVETNIKSKKVVN